MTFEEKINAPGERRTTTQIFWSTQSPPEFSEYRSLRLALALSDAPQEIRFRLGDLPAWEYERPITALRWDPAACENATIRLTGISFSHEREAAKGGNR